MKVNLVATALVSLLLVGCLPNNTKDHNEDQYDNLAYDNIEVASNGTITFTLTEDDVTENTSNEIE